MILNNMLESRANTSTSVDFTPCDKCGAMTAWLRCVMCGGDFDLHCPQGKDYPKM